MTNLKNKTVCFCDHGLFVSFARKLAPAFGKAYYYKPSGSAFRKSTDEKIGTGFPELERIDTPLLKADQIDLWVFLDLHMADLQCFLSDHGARVFGGRMGEEMETDRVEFKKYLKKLDLPVGPYEVVIGTEALKRYLQSHSDVYVKNFGLTRGVF